MDLTYKIDLAAPRDMIWDAWTRPEHLASWLCSRATVDPVVGGAYDLCWKDLSTRGQILSIDRPRLLQAAWWIGERELAIEAIFYPTLLGTRLELLVARPGDDRARVDRIWSAGLEELGILVRRWQPRAG
jgi:uncharacterized protein YndB with AHSA1/START domain